MTIKIQKEVWSILIVTGLLCVLCVVLGSAIKKSNPSEKPKGLANLGLIIVNFFNGLVETNMGIEYVNFLSPVIGTIGMYILTANLIGLFAIPNPTANFSVTLTMAFFAWLVIEGTQIKVKGAKGFFGGLFEPFALFLPVNIFGELSPLLSLSMRLFGNILVGGVLMQLVYAGTSLLSGLIPVIGKQFNIFGPVFAPLLHAYFDVFSGVIQMYIFIMVTTVLAKSKADS